MNHMSQDFTVLSKDQELRVRKLEAFYAEIRRLANSANLNDHRLVYDALTQVNPNWNESNTDWDNG